MTIYHLRGTDGTEVFTGTIEPPPGSGSQPLTITFQLDAGGGEGPTTVVGTGTLVNGDGLLWFQGLDPGAVAGNEIVWNAMGMTDGAGEFYYGLVIITGESGASASLYMLNDESLGAVQIPQAEIPNLSAGLGILRANADGTMGFYGATPIAQPTVSEATAAAIITALAALGLIVDGT